jgi:hypothetical protein
MRFTLDRKLLITTEETLLNIVKMDEKELETTKKDMDQLFHLAKYYQDSTKEVLFLWSEF